MSIKIKRIFLKIFPILFLVGVVVAFYWKFFFKGLVPFPGDLMVGAYLPWLDYKWGNVVGVAVKNTFISDIFSEFYPEKINIVRAFVTGQWPVWEPSIYSGFPLFASFNTGALNPFNLLISFFGNINGWSLLVISQPLFSSIFMYLFLKSINKKDYSSLVGAIVYSFGGFAMSWSQFVNAGYILVWLPLIFLVIEKAKQKNNSHLLLFLSPLFFLSVTAGHFQGLVYSAILAVTYFIYRNGLRNKKTILVFVFSTLLAIGFSCLQLLPTIELLGRSIRFDDGMIAGYNYGLLPKQNLITMIAPDFFGNPSTGNFWGFYNYHETISYLGVIGFVALIFGIFYYKKLTIEKYFSVITVLGLFFQFDSPLGRAIYLYKVPFLSTCAAGRVGIVVLFGAAVMVAGLMDYVDRLNKKDILKLFILPISFMAVGGGIAFLSNKLFLHYGFNSQQITQIKYNIVALRNLVIPAGLTLTLLLLFLVATKIKPSKYLIIVIVLLDLFRFGWKYLPFVPQKYVFPDTEVTDFIKKDKTIYRVEKERGEILPPNTWMGYDLMSPSGFDPLAVTKYVNAYRKDLNGYTEGGVSRYSELDRIDATDLGKYNVKYLLAIKRNEKKEISGDIINEKINQDEWKKVFETKSVAVLQNGQYLERARIIDSSGSVTKDKVEITEYQSNRVIVKFENINGDRLLLADSYYPGWVAYVNGHQTKIMDDVRPFRTVDIRGINEGEVIFKYDPLSYRIGLIISEISFVFWLVWLVAFRKH